MYWGMLLMIWSGSLNVPWQYRHSLEQLRKMVGSEHSEVPNFCAREWPTVLSNLAKKLLYVLHHSEAVIFVGHKGLSQTPLSFVVWYTPESCSAFCFCGSAFHGQICRDPKFNTSKAKLPPPLLLLFLYFLPWHHHPLNQTELFFPPSTYLCEQSFSVLRAIKEKKSNINDAKSCLIIAIITLHPLTQELIWERKATLGSLNMYFPLCLLVINQHLKILFWSILDKESFQKLTQLRTNF